MPPVEETKPEGGDAPMRGSIIGIIYPPPEVRNIVDKTASFVARNGIEFEKRIRQNELNNPKFNFLNQTDPYHAYYQHKVKEFKDGKGQEPSAAKSGSALGIAPLKTQHEQLKIIEPIVPKEPPPEFEFIADPPSISAFDLDVVKLTAQFVARNGRGFLTNLMNREQRNYQFDFLRPQHSLFNYFTKLVEQYTKILIPPKTLLGKLRKQADNPPSVLEKVRYRVEWAKFQEREKQKEEEVKEKERVCYAQIDWHDFVVVETVDFLPNETGNLPPPTTPDEVGARMLAQERFEELGDDQEAEAVEMEVVSDGEDEADDKRKHKPRKRGADTTVQDMDEESASESSDEEPEVQRRGPPAPPRPPVPPPAHMMQERRDKGQPPLPPVPPPPPKDSPQPPPLPPTPDKVIIKEYNPKAAKQTEADGADYVISPLTGEKIPAHKIQEHMRIGLLDPKWIEVRDRAVAEKREEQEVYAAGASIGSTLKNLAARRTDIFGSGEETQIGKMIGEEETKKSDKIVWDGHTASMEKVSQKARENISIEQQIATIHKSKGLMPDEEKEKIGPTPKGIPKLMPPAPPIIIKSTMPPLPPAPKQNIPPAPPRPPKIAPPPQPPKAPLQKMPIPPPPMPQLPVPVMVVPPRPPVPPMMGLAAPVVTIGGAIAPLMTMPRPPMPPRPPAAPVKQPAKSASADEPAAKKAKTEDQLIPEGQFLLKYPEGQVTFRVQVPSLTDKPEWKCTGQFISLTLPLTDTVSVIKAKIHDSINMPVGKQKLQFEGMFIKDSNSLAFYNLTKTSVIQLQLKERGGRKK